jgi:hypothetical protein
MGRNRSLKRRHWTSRLWHHPSAVLHASRHPWKGVSVRADEAEGDAQRIGTVLVVDDDGDSRDLFTTILAQQAPRSSPPGTSARRWQRSRVHGRTSSCVTSPCPVTTASR